MCVTEINGIYLNKSSVLSQFENIVHGFTARQGGVSTGCYESLSMSPRRGDDPRCVRKNEEILCRALSLDLNRLTSTKQEHTANIEIIDEAKIGHGVLTMWENGVDGCITRIKNVPLLCYSADCVPILLYASDIEAIGAVHAGWRGSESQIVKRCVEEMKGLGAGAENIFAAIGPCIGKCCYEVSDDVALKFNECYYDDKGGGKYMLDLSAVNCGLLKECGVPGENISLSGVCTKCRNDLFFSHRGQGGKSGTLGGIICMVE